MLLIGFDWRRIVDIDMAEKPQIEEQAAVRNWENWEDIPVKRAELKRKIIPERKPSML
ncbi:MAG: hypothetical protein JW720_09245 [Sedimentisphaerales bacterium]|nr:hypothetical protein [Sedimentisphaerales bacterium]